MRITAYLLSTCLILFPSAAAAQPAAAVDDKPRLVISEKALADARVAAQRAPSTERDSLKNGTLIGAAIGAAVMGGFVTFLCNALQEPSDPSCLGSSLMGFGIGAGAGAVGGLAVDAMLGKQPRRLVEVRVPLRTPK